jgi:hypothetical protein
MVHESYSNGYLRQLTEKLGFCLFIIIKRVELLHQILM